MRAFYSQVKSHRDIQTCDYFVLTGISSDCLRMFTSCRTPTTAPGAQPAICESTEADHFTARLQNLLHSYLLKEILNDLVPER
jgi:hypothetical protein